MPAAQRPFHRLLVVTLLSPSCSCAWSPKPMLVPPELVQASERYSVSGHVQTFRSEVSFGPYRTARAKLGAKKGVDSAATLFNGQKERSSSTQTVDFELPTPSGVTFRGRCVHEREAELQHETTVVIDKHGLEAEDAVSDARYRESYDCTIDRAGAPTVKMTAGGGSLPVVSGRDPEVTLAPVRHAEGAAQGDHRAGAFGYVLMEGERLVAALDLSEHLESVTLRRDLPQLKKDELAAICMALLLRRDMQ